MDECQESVDRLIEWVRNKYHIACLLYGEGTMEDILKEKNNEALMLALEGKLSEYKGIEFVVLNKGLSLGMTNYLRRCCDCR